MARNKYDLADTVFIGIAIILIIGLLGWFMLIIIPEYNQTHELNNSLRLGADNFCKAYASNKKFIYGDGFISIWDKKVHCEYYTQTDTFHTGKELGGLKVKIFSVPEKDIIAWSEREQAI